MNPCIQCYANINCKGCITKIKGEKMVFTGNDDELSYNERLKTINALRQETKILLAKIKILEETMEEIKQDFIEQSWRSM